MSDFSDIINFTVGISESSAAVWKYALIGVLYVPVIIFILRFFVGVDGRRRKTDLALASLFFVVTRLINILL